MTTDTVNTDYPSAVYRSSGYDHAIGTRHYRAFVPSIVRWSKESPSC